MNWNKIDSEEILKQLDKESNDQKILIFKHSTRCSTSSMVLSRLERNWKDTEMKDVKPYFLDLVNHRDLSKQIAEMYAITHESPQLLIISEGKCLYNASHSDIYYDSIASQI